MPSEWMQRTFCSVAALTCAAIAVAGCADAQSEAQRQVGNEAATRRDEVVQSVAAAGAMVVGGTQSGTLLVSSDGGSNWSRRAAESASIIAIAACPDGSFIAIDFYGHVLPIDASGSPSARVALDKPETPLTVACDPQGRWWVAGTFATIAMSADRGKSWQVQEFDQDAQLTALQFIDQDHAILAGEFGLMFSSDDAGATWKRMPVMPNELYPYSLWFRTPTEGWVSGIAGQVLHTTDGGKQWSREANVTDSAIYQLVADGDRLLGIGAGGVFARGEDAVWRRVSVAQPLPVFLGSAAISNGQLVVGGPGIVTRMPLNELP